MSTPYKYLIEQLEVLALAHLAAHTVSLTVIAQAYAELLQISCQHDVAMVQHFNQTGDAAAAHLLQELNAGQQDVDATLGLIIPGVMSSDGHVPNQLPDFLLQVFGWRVQAGIESGCCSDTFQKWQRELSPDVAVEAAVVVSRRQPPSTRTASEPPPVVRNVVAPVEAVDSSSLVTIEVLHPHACSRHNSARFGARRRCSLCNAHLPRETQFFRCSHSCRFVAYQSCFRIPTVAAVPADGAPPRVLEPGGGDAGASAHVAPQLTNVCNL